MALVACTALLVLVGVVSSARWRGCDATARTAAMIAALDLNTLAATPSGRSPRLPGGAHPAVVLRHVPGVVPPAQRTDAVDH